MTRATVYFSGHVQGVGFRFTTHSISRRYKVLGYVRNLPDRTVEVVAEGGKAEVQAFIQDVSQTMTAFIQKTDVSWSDPTNEFNRFGVRF